MYSLAHYALFGSLIAGAAGALVLAVVTIRHGFMRREAPDPDEAPETAARRQRNVRLADTVAVLCFAVSAGLGVMGLMQHARAVTPAVAATDDSTLSARLQALEKRVATTELELQARGAPAPDWRAWEERIARLENRLGAVEDRAAVAERRLLRSAPATTTPRPPTPAKPAPAPSASPRLSPPPPARVKAPEATAPPPPPDASVSVPAPTAAPALTATPPALTATTPAPRVPARPRVEAPADDASLGEKLRRDWDTIKRHARRGGEEWREGWDQIKRLFRY